MSEHPEGQPVVDAAVDAFMRENAHKVSFMREKAQSELRATDRLVRTPEIRYRRAFANEILRRLNR